MRLRRSRTVIAYWRNERLVFENYCTRTAITADPKTLIILDFFEHWHTSSELCEHMPEYTNTSIKQALRQLVEHGLIVQEGTGEAWRDVQLEDAWSAWLPHAAAFHFATRDASYSSREEREGILREYLAQSPQPPFFKNYRGQPQIQLAEPIRPHGEFLRVLLARRTHREFSSKGLPFDLLSQLLFYTWGVTGFLSPSLLGRLPAKTSPSAGARHPVEVYVASLRVDGLEEGLYHYAAQRHCLELLRRGRVSTQAAKYCAGQEWVNNTGALFLMTAMLPRSMWKYRSARAYRTVLLDAGHLCQTFCLLATWLGLAPFCTMALKESMIEKDLGLDGVTEGVIYVAGVGTPRAGRQRLAEAAKRRLASL